MSKESSSRTNRKTKPGSECDGAFHVFTNESSKSIFLHTFHSIHFNWPWGLFTLSNCECESRRYNFFDVCDQSVRNLDLMLTTDNDVKIAISFSANKP